MVDQRRFDNQRSRPRAEGAAESVERWVDSRTAAAHLGVQQRTLYAYVSRGQVRSVAGSKGRPRLYLLADLERLRVRSSARSGHGPVAAGALRWGEPVLDSAITAITPRGPVYRGHVATELAASQTRFENVAELLWSGYLPPAPVTWPRTALPIAQLGKLVPAGAGPLDVMSLVVQLAALGDPHRADGRPDAVVARGRALIPLLAATLTPDLHTPSGAATITRALGAPTVATIAARSLGLADEVAPLLEVALVVLADHELNASSFTARVTASTEADPYACIAAALATVSGPLHGSASEAIARYADEVGAPEHARAAATSLRKAQRTPPGFGHPLYPDGDPRATPLIDHARVLADAGSRTNPSLRRARTIIALVDAITHASRKDDRPTHPTVDIGLAALVAALGARPAAGSGLFALARSAGWLAHALEQRAAGFLLRPRARYTGVPVTA